MKPRVTFDNFRNVSIDDCHLDFSEIVADTTVWLMNFIAQCQKMEIGAVEGSFRFTEMPSQVIWQRYPANCPGCFDHWLISLLDLKRWRDATKETGFQAGRHRQSHTGTGRRRQAAGPLLGV